ncbi:MAG: DUF4190 domain-containing protein [Planctomycetales bacterium]|nr:DUF4190 domain-containing protein [Planctomycetales bacterium]
MPISFTCSSCGRNLKTPDEMAGKKGKCPHCQAVMEIPLKSEGAASGPWKEAPSPADDLFGNLGSTSAPPPPKPAAYQAPRAANPYAGPAYQNPGRPMQQGGGPSNSGRAVTSLVCGIIGLVFSVISWGCCCLGPFMLGGEGIALTLSLIGWITGHIELRATRPNSPTRGQATGGMVCGIIGTVFSTLTMLGYGAWLVFFISVSVAS